MDFPRPRVSILIPNYDNGRASSRGGQTDFIGDLLASLHQTLADDPTPVEIIVYDDGSTDDSLATLRSWAQKTWRGGQPFLQLIEAEHCGVLARTANALVRASRGEILARLDGDTVMLTRHWASRLCEVFDQGPQRLGVVGPKQLRVDGRIHAYGDWLLHPKGYHHIAVGLPREAAAHPLEVDHVMGCFYCCKRQVYDELGGYDEAILRGQTIDFGLRARLKGWSCIAVPHIEYVHRHGLRTPRATKADTVDGVLETLDTFRRKWGFDRLAPDLDVVRERYARTPLLWNARVFGAPAGAVGDGPTTEKLEDSEWARYGQDAALQQHVDQRIRVAMQVIQEVGRPRHLAVIGCGAGLLTHLLATQGLACTGTDRSAARLALARQCTARHAYPGPRPTFAHQTDRRRLPLADASAPMVLLCDQLERHDNPVALLREAQRVVTPGGLMVIVSQRAASSVPAMLEAEHRYLLPELAAQVNAVGGWLIVSDTHKDDPQGPMILIARSAEAEAE